MISGRTSAASVPTRWDVVVFRTLDTYEREALLYSDPPISDRVDIAHDIFIERPRIVRYVAPAFYTEGQFDAAFFANEVSDRSVFVAPSQILLPDDQSTA